MHGLCYSAMTYAPLMVDRNVVVVGDELLALRAVAELSRIATQVTLIAQSRGRSGYRRWSKRYCRLTM